MLSERKPRALHGSRDSEGEQDAAGPPRSIALACPHGLQEVAVASP
jgi:hypothetical protein